MGQFQTSSSELIAMISFLMTLQLQPSNHMNIIIDCIETREASYFEMLKTKSIYCHVGDNTNYENIVAL